MGAFMNYPILKNKNTNLNIGERVLISNNVVLGPNCKKIIIGYGSYIGENVYIDVPELTIGEYTTIHKGTTIHGYEPCEMGNNCWVGQNCIIDSIGGVKLGNNIGVGAYSQLWSHIKFGDSLEGCKFNSSNPLIVEDDVWFVGHCIVSPIHAKKKSMLMVGGVITKNMEENHVYGGSPAKDLTDKIGNQFIEVSYEEKLEKFNSMYKKFLEIHELTTEDYEIDVVKDLSTKDNRTKTTFDIINRRYYPNRSNNEYKFMKYLLYDKAKFNPYV